MTLGIGLTLCVVIDATVVRSIVVPAAMQLLGRANWWPAQPVPDRHRIRPSLSKELS
jgi:RND superfamily putative drug exporter